MYNLSYPEKIIENLSALSLKDRYLQLVFTVSHEAGAHALYAVNDHLRLVIFGLIDLFSTFILPNVSGKYIKIKIMLTLQA